PAGPPRRRKRRTGMHAERWERVQTLFHAALELPKAERRAFLERECAGDPGLAADVLAMLAADAHGETILDSGLAGVAGDVLREPEPVRRTIGPYRLVGLPGWGGWGRTAGRSSSPSARATPGWRRTCWRCCRRTPTARRSSTAASPASRATCCASRSRCRARSGPTGSCGCWARAAWGWCIWRS